VYIFSIMLPNYLSEFKINQFISLALLEDVGNGDHTSLSSIPTNANGFAQLYFKENGIVAGLELSKFIFNHINKDLELAYYAKDGDRINKGEVGLKVYGNIQSILKAERLVLNCMQRMSGVATLTNQFLEKISHTQAQLLDTRKTTPNFRMMEKWAVHIAGAVNHRFGLYDMILLKDNHIDYCGGVAKAILSAKKYLDENNLDLFIEIETRTLAEVQEAIHTGFVHRILLDNMDIETLQQAIKLVNGKVATEASGGVNLSTIQRIAETGVDFISVGQLTHSYQSLDISLKATKQ
jgi:nicotinate-nucleotide pyrophosphorylase (carboxylating)